MPRMPDLLHRFLPAGAPGPAGMAGVPTDRVADATAELAPLFAQLATTEARCDEILDEARRDAAVTAERATERVHSLAGAARQRAASERADAMARARKVIQEQNEAESAAAKAEAARLQARAAERIPAYVSRVTAVITDMIAAGRPTDPT